MLQRQMRLPSVARDGDWSDIHAWVLRGSTTKVAKFPYLMWGVVFHCLRIVVFLFLKRPRKQGR